MTGSVKFYGSPDSAAIKLISTGINILSIPQVPNNYTTVNLWGDIEEKTGIGTIEVIWSWVNGDWVRTFKIGSRFFNSELMVNDQFYFVHLKNNVSKPFPITWEPFSVTE